jgi:hypothetical protein
VKSSRVKGVTTRVEADEDKLRAEQACKEVVLTAVLLCSLAGEAEARRLKLVAQTRNSFGSSHMLVMVSILNR